MRLGSSWRAATELARHELGAQTTARVRHCDRSRVPTERLILRRGHGA